MVIYVTAVKSTVQCKDDGRDKIVPKIYSNTSRCGGKESLIINRYCTI